MLTNTLKGDWRWTDQNYVILFCLLIYFYNKRQFYLQNDVNEKEAEEAEKEWKKPIESGS